MDPTLNISKKRMSDVTAQRRWGVATSSSGEQHQEDADNSSIHMFTPLMLAALAGHDTTVSRLLQEDSVDANHRHRLTGRTALVEALRTNRPSTVALLLAAIDAASVDTRIFNSSYLCANNINTCFATPLTPLKAIRDHELIGFCMVTLVHGDVHDGRMQPDRECDIECDRPSPGRVDEEWPCTEAVEHPRGEVCTDDTPGQKWHKEQHFVETQSADMPGTRHVVCLRFQHQRSWRLGKDAVCVGCT